MTGRQEEIYKKYKDYGFEILLINLYRTETESTKKYAAQKGIKYPILLANDDVLNRYGGIKATPTLFLLDSLGKIVEVFLFDRFNESSLYHMENKIRSLLKLESLPLPEPTSQMNLEILKANKAPNFSLPTMDGKAVTLYKLSKPGNKAVVLVFWSINDGASVGALLYSQYGLYKKYHQRGLEVIGVNIDMEDKTKARAASFLKVNQIKIPVVRATPELIKEYGNVNITPLIILIDRSGYTKEIYEKYNNEILIQIESDVLSLLKPTPSPLKAYPKFR